MTTTAHRKSTSWTCKFLFLRRKINSFSIKNARKKSTGAAPPVIQNAAPARTSTEPKTINLLPKLANKEQVVDLNSYKLNAYAQNPTQQKAQSLGTYLSPEAQALKTSGGRPKISFDNFESAQEDTLTQRKIPPSRLSNPTSSTLHPFKQAAYLYII